MAADDIGSTRSTEAPMDIISSAIAGKIGGWWGTRAAADAVTSYAQEDDLLYRDRYENSPRQLADRAYGEVRPAYQLGHLAKRNPDYAGRDFHSIEPELRAGWTDLVASRYGEWGHVREFVREAYTHDFSVTAREATIRENAPDDNLADMVVNTNRSPESRVAGAIDDRGNDKGEDGHSEARLFLPVSRR